MAVAVGYPLLADPTTEVAAAYGVFDLLGDGVATSLSQTEQFTGAMSVKTSPTGPVHQTYSLASAD